MVEEASLAHSMQRLPLGDFLHFTTTVKREVVLVVWGRATMTVSLPFTLTTLSDAPPDSWAAQQYRAASNTQSTDRATSGSGESSATAEDDDDDFASALATAMTMASNVSSTPVVPQTGGTSSANSQGVSASAVSPVMPQSSGTSQLTGGQEASSVSATPVMPGVAV